MFYIFFALIFSVFVLFNALKLLGFRLEMMGEILELRKVSYYNQIHCIVDFDLL